MLPLSIFQTVEFYVIITVIAAAITAYLAIPAGRGEARQHLLAGTLTDRAADVAQHPSISLTVRPDGSVLLHRSGLTDVRADGAVSLSVKVIGFDVTIEERIVPGRGRSADPDPSGADFVLDFFGPEWYHIKYNSESIGRFCAVALHVRPGIVVERPLAY